MSTPEFPPPPAGVRVPPAPDSPRPPEESAGWFPDPNGRHEFRYFNGRAWTADVADAGHRSVDPLGSGPAPAAGSVAPWSAAPGFVTPPAARRRGLATAALVCGIVGVILAWIPFIVVAGFVLAVLAIAFGAQSVRTGGLAAGGGGMAIAGIVLGAVGIALSVIGVILSVAAIREVRDFVDPERHDVQLARCRVVDRAAHVTGTITNRSSEPAAFTVFVEIEADGRSEHVERIDTLGPGESAGFDATDFSPGNAETCRARVDVFGPFPFDVPMDRP